MKRLLTIPAIFLLAGSSGVRGQCQYEVTIIQALGCNDPPPTIGTAINEHGHIAGYYYQCASGDFEAFVWTPKSGLTTLPRPPGVFSSLASDISDGGDC